MDMPDALKKKSFRFVPRAVQLLLALLPVPNTGTMRTGEVL